MFPPPLDPYPVAPSPDRAAIAATDDGCSNVENASADVARRFTAPL